MVCGEIGSVFEFVVVDEMMEIQQLVLLCCGMIFNKTCGLLSSAYSTGVSGFEVVEVVKCVCQSLRLKKFIF